MISKKELDSVLNYNPESGVFTWRGGVKGKKEGDVAGTNSRGYVRIFIKGRGYMAHRLAYLHMTGRMPCAEIDHKNGVRDDNSYSNLRIATRSQNCANRKPSGSSPKGCYWSSRRGKWVAQITKDGKRKTIGYFDDVCLASEAYQKEAKELHGSFAFIR